MSFKNVLILFVGLTIAITSPVHAQGPGCCVNRGDTDYSGGENPIDVADIVYLVDYFFEGGAEPPCLEQADVDGSGYPPGIDIADLLYLVSYIFQNGPLPPLCSDDTPPVIVTLPYGLSTPVDQYGISLRLIDVEEGRCGSQVFCFWEGLASATLELTLSNSEVHYVKVGVHGGIMSATGYWAIPIEAYGFRFIMSMLMPYPLNMDPVPDNIYTATVLVEALDLGPDIDGRAAMTYSSWVQFNGVSGMVSNLVQTGNMLNFDVTYTGGCVEHHFTLLQRDNFSGPVPHGADLYLIETTDGDPCDGVVTVNLTIDINSLLELMLDTYGQLEPIMFNLDGNSLLFTPD